MASRATVVLVPFQGGIHPACDAGLIALERQGLEVWRVGGYASIDLARSQMATDALAQGFDRLLWIDSDIGFRAEDVARLLGRGQPLVGGVYVKKGLRALACHLLPETRTVTFGQRGGLVEVCYAAAGFLLTAREVFEAIQSRLDLPVCNTEFQRPVVPYFMPMILPSATGESSWYLGEDFAFCERARQCDYRVLVDTTIRLAHFGSYGYTWEDAGSERVCYETYHYRVR